MDNQAYGGYPQAGVPNPQGVAHGLGSKINSSSSFDIDIVKCKGNEKNRMIFFHNLRTEFKRCKS